ncbi:MAG: aminomethyl-transferring glycine dehydrogenase subunit GcvPA [bacterium]
MRYLPLTEADKLEMLKKTGADHIDDLFDCIPSEVKVQEELCIPRAKSEMELLSWFRECSAENKGSVKKSFLGGGYYDHFIPSAIDQILSRSEYYTSYTPYQPEASQGTLQTIFEFQSMISSLMNMDVSNASMYDGASSAAEAVLLALRVKKKRKKVVMFSTLHPAYSETIKTYARSIAENFEILEMDVNTGTVKEGELDKIDGNTACVVFQYPNYFGCMENINLVSEKTHDKKALLIPVVTDATALGVFSAPGDFDADIAVGEGQSLGIPMQFGGPGLGLFTVKKKFARKMPGRVAGRTVDRKGKESYVLTLAAREQHIRRERATSNICTNSGLMATAAAVYLSLTGPEGLRKTALMNIKRMRMLKDKIARETSARIAFNSEGYNEFTVLFPRRASEVEEAFRNENYLPGIKLSKYYPELDNAMLITVTERHSEKDLDGYVSVLKKIVGGAS